MIDATTQQRLRVSTDGNAGPYIIVPLVQLEELCAVLSHGDIEFWVDDEAISLDGRPEVAVINLGREVDAAKVQSLLDQNA